MSILGTGSIHLAGRYGKAKPRKKSDSSQALCQRCLQRGHWSYECPNPRAYVSRPSRTQQLAEGGNTNKFLDPKDIPEEIKEVDKAQAERNWLMRRVPGRSKGTEDKAKVQTDKKRKRKDDESSSSSSQDSSGGSSSSSSSGSSDTSSSSSDSSDASSGAADSRDTSSPSQDSEKVHRKKRQAIESSRSPNRGIDGAKDKSRRKESKRQATVGSDAMERKTDGDKVPYGGLGYKSQGRGSRQQKSHDGNRDKPRDRSPRSRSIRENERHKHK